MIAVDTNILARFYCDDPDDPEAKRQQVIARRVMVESEAIFVPLTVVLEFEWVMRGFYEAEPSSFCDAMAHLLGMRHVTVERWEAVNDAVNLHRRGLDFADALHLTSRNGTMMAFQAEFHSYWPRRSRGKSAILRSASAHRA